MQQVLITRSQKFRDDPIKIMPYFSDIPDFLSSVC